jgi:hypothetical protein
MGSHECMTTRGVYSYGVSMADDWLARYRRFWTDSFDKMEAYIAELKAKESPDER